MKKKKERVIPPAVLEAFQVALNNVKVHAVTVNIIDRSVARVVVTLSDHNGNCFINVPVTVRNCFKDYEDIYTSDNLRSILTLN